MHYQLAVCPQDLWHVNQHWKLSLGLLVHGKNDWILEDGSVGPLPGAFKVIVQRSRGQEPTVPGVSVVDACNVRVIAEGHSGKGGKEWLLCWKIRVRIASACNVCDSEYSCAQFHFTG